MKTWFYLLNAGMLLVFAASLYKDNDREWKTYQQAYFDKSAAELQVKLAQTQDPQSRADIQNEIDSWKSHPLQIKQILANDLGRVDRCITCHVGMDPYTNPTQINDFTENPYKSHPDVTGLIKDHPVTKYGCTVCHAGQGMATTVAAAHGDVANWEHPLLKEPFIQASCAKCHADFQHLKGAEQAALGKSLFDKNGCIGCHSMNGVGGVISVDLGDIADKPSERIQPLDFVRAHRSENGNLPEEYSKIDAQDWILAHLMADPLKFVRNDPEGHYNTEPIAPSGMPPFYLELKDGDAQAIATWLLSKSHEEKIPSDYYVYEAPKPEPHFASPAEHGNFVFHKYGCAACHGIDATAGRRIFNGMGDGQDASVLISGTDAQKFDEMSKGREPTLRKTLSTYTRDEIRNKIMNGVQGSAIAKFNPRGPVPPAYMPAWKEKIKGPELEDLITWLISVEEKAKAGSEW